MNANPPSLQRRARPLLGTLVDVGTDGDGIAAAFEAIEQVQRRMSRFDPGSDIARFNALPAGAVIEVHAWTAEVLQAARSLREASGGSFDISVGSGADGWHCRGHQLLKRQAQVQLDLGGIAKGFAVDQAVRALQRAGATHGWVNAGGDLRVFGAIALPVTLRDEQAGGVRPFGQLSHGALATSRFAPDSRSRHAGAGVQAHVSVAAPLCLWADALTKVVAAHGRIDHPLLAQHGAQAWLH